MVGFPAKITNVLYYQHHYLNPGSARQPLSTGSGDTGCEKAWMEYEWSTFMAHKYRTKEDIERLRKLSRIVIFVSLVVLCMAGVVYLLIDQTSMTTSGLSVFELLLQGHPSFASDPAIC